MLTELFLVGTFEGDSDALLDTASLRRLIFDVFHEDPQQFRDYCLQDEGYQSFVDFLDQRDGSGWQLLKKLWQGDTPVRELLSSGFS